MVIFNSYVSLPEGTDDYKMAKVCKWMFVFTSPWEFTGSLSCGEPRDLDERDGKNHHRGSSGRCLKTGLVASLCFFLMATMEDGYIRETPQTTRADSRFCVCEVWIVLMLCSTGCAGSSPKCQGHDVAALYFGCQTLLIKSPFGMTMLLWGPMGPNGPWVIARLNPICSWFIQ